MNPSACPSARELEDLLDDRLPPELVRLVDQHLRTCSNCLSRLNKLSRERERAELPGLARVESRPNDRTPTPDEPADETEVELPEGITIGPCEVIREIGRGGMGVVYEAKNRGSGFRVAIKILAAPALSRKNAAARFANEARAMSRLRHPGIVQVYDAGIWQQGRGMPPVPYTILELVTGPSLRTLLAEGPIPHRDAAALVESIARAVHHAHENGVIHRDLKPANILLAGVHGTVRNPELDPDADPSADPPASPYAALKPKVTDFGIAKLRDETTGLTGSRDLLGTPEYMPPELGEPNRPVSAAMDVYALGVILFECITGRVPFRGASPVQTLLLAQSREAAPPSKHQPDVPRALDAIVLKCLEKNPTRRYTSAAKLADDLAAFLRGETDPAPAVIRRRAAFGLLTVAVLTASIAIVFASRKPKQQIEPTPQTPIPALQLTPARIKGLVPTESHPGTQKLEFRQGVAGYQGCSVVELRSSPLDGEFEKNFSNLPAATIATRGSDRSTHERQALLRFDHIFGTESGRVPLGSTIQSAKLCLWMVNDRGGEMHFHRILGPWNPGTTTWANFQLLGNREPGIQGDDVETERLSLNSDSRARTLNIIDVTADTRRWASGEPSLGWGITTNSTSPMIFHSAEAEGTETRPLLKIEYAPPSRGRVTAVGDVYRTVVDRPLVVTVAKSVLRNDWADSGLTASSIGQPMHGKVEFQSNGSFRYTPKPGFCGRDSFSYVAASGDVTDVAKVVIFVE